MADRIEIYDLLLIIALVVVAYKALLGREAFTSTIFFVVYGLLMSIAWVQLGAVDVALAEACIGAGLTGALLISAIRQFEGGLEIDRPSHTRMGLPVIAGLLSIVLFLGLSSAILSLSEPVGQVPSLVNENITVSGTSHTVTAVLLNFRAFDTWMELGVLLLASMAAIIIHRIYDGASMPAFHPSLQSQPRIVAKLMLPLLILIGGVILWFGSQAPGGAFQAGALIGAAGILMQISGERRLLRNLGLRVRIFLVMGFFTFLVISSYTFLMGRRILEYTSTQASSMILILEIAATLSIALTLNIMYACSQPWRQK